VARPGPVGCQRTRLLAIGLLGAAGIVFASFGGTVQAEPTWSEPALLFSTGAYVTRPALIADSDGVVHLMFVLRESKTSGTETPATLMYTRIQDNTWSTPTDVLVSPDGGPLNLPAASIDQQQSLNVVWEGGPSNQIFYSRAQVTQAGSARAWSSPQPLSAAGGRGSDIVASADGSLHVVFASRQGDIYYRRSADGGQTWSTELAISDIQGERVADYPRVVVDGRGRLHVVWTQFESAGGTPPYESMYTRSVDGGTSWSAPRKVADHTAAVLALAAAGQDRVQLAWGGPVGTGERRHQWSSDGGQTWAAPEVISLVLSSGPTNDVTLMGSNDGKVHLLTSAGGRDGKAADVYYLAWDGVRWTEPELVSARAVGRRSIGQPALALGSGDRIEAVYIDDFQRVWSRSAGGAQQLAVGAAHVTAPTPTATPPASPFAPTAFPAPIADDATPTPAEKPMAQRATPSVDRSSTANLNPLVASTAAVMVLLCGALVVRALRHR
jgi:hypothetical protein